MVGVLTLCILTIDIYDEALDLWIECFDDMKASLGEESAEVATLLMNMGSCYEGMHKFVNLLLVYTDDQDIKKPVSTT